MDMGDLSKRVHSVRVISITYLSLLSYCCSVNLPQEYAEDADDGYSDGDRDRAGTVTANTPKQVSTAP